MRQLEFQSNMEVEMEMLFYGAVFLVGAMFVANFVRP